MDECNERRNSVYRELKGHIVVRIPTHRSQFPASGSHIMFNFFVCDIRHAINDMRYKICELARVLSDYPLRITGFQAGALRFQIFEH
jgi:hypothetical protein